MCIHFFLRPKRELAVSADHSLASDAGSSAIVLVAFLAALGLEVGLEATLAAPSQAKVRVPHMLLQVLLTIEVSANGC
jgi:hypothetical protein